jgi:hypothetical protein
MHYGNAFQTFAFSFYNMIDDNKVLSYNANMGVGYVGPMNVEGWVPWLAYHTSYIVPKQDYQKLTTQQQPDGIQSVIHMLQGMEFGHAGS